MFGHKRDKFKEKTLNSAPLRKIKDKLKGGKEQPPVTIRPDIRKNTVLDLEEWTGNTVFQEGVLYIIKFGHGYFSYKARNLDGNIVGGFIYAKDLGCQITERTSIADLKNHAEILGKIFDIALREKLIRLQHSPDQLLEALQKEPELQRIIEDSAAANARLVDSDSSRETESSDTEDEITGLIITLREMEPGGLPPDDLPPEFIPPLMDLPLVLPPFPAFERRDSLRQIQLQMPVIQFLDERIETEIRKTDRFPEMPVNPSKTMPETENAFFTLQALNALKIAGYICLGLVVAAGIAGVIAGLAGICASPMGVSVIAVAALVAGIHMASWGSMAFLLAFIQEEPVISSFISDVKSCFC